MNVNSRTETRYKILVELFRCASHASFHPLQGVMDKETSASQEKIYIITSVSLTAYIIHAPPGTATDLTFRTILSYDTRGANKNVVIASGNNNRAVYDLQTTKKGDTTKTKLPKERGI